MSFGRPSHFDYALHFLISHDADDAKLLGLRLDPPVVNADAVSLSSDQGASIKGDSSATITISNKTSTVTIVTGDKTFTGTFRNPSAVIDDMNNKSATLFYRGSPPYDADQFWIQQYAPRESGKPGRVVIELYTDERISAVCKTNDDNSGAAGKGTWA